MRSFLVDHDKGWDTPNRLVREIVLAGLGESEHRSCHSLAANHYTRHFEARRIEDRGGLGGHFVEARYHLGRARLAERRALRTAAPGDPRCQAGHR